MTLVETLRRSRELAAPAPQDDRQMVAKYRSLLNSSATLDKIAGAYSVVRGILNNEAFWKAAGKPRNYYHSAQADPGRAFTEAKFQSEIGKTIDVRDNAVVLHLMLPSIKFFVGATPSGASEEQTQAGSQASKMLSGLLPKLRLTDVRSEQRTNNFFLSEDTQSDLPIEMFSAINIPGVSKLDLGSWEPPIKGAIRIRLKPTEVSVDEPVLNITDAHDVFITVEMSATIALPMEFALWQQHADSRDELVPLATWGLFFAQHKYFTDVENKVPPPPNRIPHPDQPLEVLQEAQRRYGASPRPMADANGIAVLPAGRMIWVPPATSVKISGMMNECLHEGRIDLTPMQNRTLLVDWTTNKMAVTDAEGEIKLVDLTGARPPSGPALAHVAGSQIDPDAFRGLATLASRLGVDLPISSMASLAMGEIGLRWENLMDVPFYGDENSGNQMVDQGLFNAGQLLGVMYQKLIESSIPVWEQFELRPYLALFGPYQKDRASHVKALGHQLAMNRSPVDPRRDPELHDMPGVDGLMPHQRRVCNGLAEEPSGAILDVRAGGGKSLAAIHDVTNLMSGGKIRRPVIIMPRNLLGNFASEIVRFTKGRYRPFIISNRIWRGFIRRYGSSPTALIALLRSQPRNTIFLVDYGWLTHNALTVAMGHREEESFFPHAQMILDLEPDYVALDESHRSKKLATGRTKAAAALTAVAKYRRIMSGTILHNTAMDLLGQMAQIEPMALGALAKYIEENKRVEISQLPALDLSIDSFARRIMVPRKEWAHLLPPLIERVHPCQMTRRQQEFYQKIYDRLQEQLQNDPKIRNLMKKDSAAAQARLEAIFKREFVPMEQWLNAPDSEFSANQFGQVFSQLDGLTDEDLSSAKIPVLDRLLEEHFRGGSVDIGDGPEDMPADPNKVIVFAYNRAVTEHVFRRSRFSNMGVMYQAGDDEALERFKNDPECRVLYGSVTSISEGHNLQVASRVIFLQTFWTPGMMEQAMARVWRPDVPDKEGNIKYKRERIYSDQIVIMPSIEVAKMARMFSKQIGNLLIEEMKSSKTLSSLVESNQSTFEKIKPVRMTLDHLRMLQTQDSLNTHFRAYALIKSWEKQEFREAREKVRKEIEARLGKKVPDSLLAATSMTRPIHKSDPELDIQDAIQAQGYVPWTEGFTGWNPTGLHLVPIEIKRDVEDEDEDSNGSESEDEEGPDEDEEIVHVEKGDPVWTELGPGWVASIRQKSKLMFVSVPGFRADPVKLWKYTVLAAKNPVDKAALAAILQRAGNKGLPTIQMAEGGRMVPQRNVLPADHVEEVRHRAAEAQKNGEALTTKAQPTPKGTAVQPATPGVAPSRRDITDTRKGFMYAGNYEAVRLRNVKTGERLWQIRHRNDPKIKSKPIVGKLDAKKELLRRHVEDVQKNGPALKAPGVSPEGPMFKGKPTPAPSKAPPSGKKPATPPSAINLLKVEDHPEERDVREANAGVFSGTVCLITTDGGDRDPHLLRSGFDRLAKSIAIRVRNPKAFIKLNALLQSKFDVPAPNARAMDLFGTKYQAAQAQVAYLRARELPQHQLWLRQQKSKAKTPMTVMPWPVVEDGVVYVYINIEQLNAKATSALKRLQLPPGCVKPLVVPPQMIAMVKSIKDARMLMERLKKSGVDFSNQSDVLMQFRKIKG